MRAHECRNIPVRCDAPGVMSRNMMSLIGSLLCIVAGLLATLAALPAQEQRPTIGDTAETVVRGVPCDLLLIKPESFRLRLGRTRKEAVLLPTARRRS